MEKAVIVGAGAVGAAYASMMDDHSPGCVSLLADGERFDRLSRQGITVNGRRCRIPLIRPREAVPADLVLVAVKFHDLPRAVEDIRGCVGPETAILSLLNGISSEEIIGARYGMERVLYGMVVQIDAVRRGSEVVYTTPGFIHFGEARNAPPSERVLAVKEFFDRARIPSRVPEDMIRDLWWKFMLNVGINQASAILRAPYRVFQRLPEAKSLMDAAMREVMLISRARGIHLDEADMARAHEPIAKLSPEGKTSMLQDIEAGRRTEVEMFSREVVAQGETYGIPTPVNQTLYWMIRTLEKERELGDS